MIRTEDTTTPGRPSAGQTPADGPPPADARHDLAAALRLFASIFQREVDEPLLGELLHRAGAIASVLGADPLADIDCTDTAAAVETLATEFCGLFIGPAGHLPPTESVVRGEGRFWGPSTEKVAAFYRDVGFEPAEGTHLLPDHVSMELACLALLEESGRSDRAAAFAREHLLGWLPALQEHVRRRARLGFYRIWIDVLGNMLEQFYTETKSES